MSEAAPSTVEAVVVGAGVVGLACAASLARTGRSVVVLERHDGLARETSSRNSEVIHAGIYYPPGSAKAVLCVRGRELLYDRCATYGVPHRQLGKLIVATRPDEVAVLERLCARGRENGAGPLEIVDAAEVRRREPAVRACAALVSPLTGIVDAHALALSYAAELESCGSAVVMPAALEALEPASGWLRLVVRDADGETTRLEAGAVVNAAGLEADRVAARAGIDVDTRGWRLRPCKGDYFALAPGAPLALSGLVYPVPSGSGPLGIHATLDLGGRVRFGPDAEYVDAPRYDVDPAKAATFAAAVARYLPDVRAEWLTPDFAGVRPRLSGPGEPAADFAIREESEAGLPGLVNLVGIESPGLTAAGAIAERVVSLLGGR